MVQITSAAPALLVRDVFETAEYYRDVLGFSFDGIFGAPPSFVIVERDGVRLMFRQPPSGAPRASNETLIAIGRKHGASAAQVALKSQPA